jgi:hypothetical protein
MNTEKKAGIQNTENPKIEIEENPVPKLIGILKPPPPCPTLRSFPSLPEDFINRLNIGSAAGSIR